ncbi:MAG: NHLP bacteriocin export ABC transporter permease/ATPase subunit [Eubacteriales bacterium]|nr:NHLP bacteriocin export ABC transporter permease/ATPase subunit [Eubacteriales bacterium]
MGWFDEQIKQRVQNDDNAFCSAFADMSSVVMGKKILDGDFYDDTKRAKDAVAEILKFYHVPMQELPVNVNDINDVLEYLLRPSGIMRRSVTLSDNWYKDGMGALLCTTKDGTVTALIPKGTKGYTFFDRNLGKMVTVNSKNADQINREAVCFYKPFPLKELTAADLLKYILNTLSITDYISVALATLAVSLIGLLSAYANNMIFSTVVHSDSTGLLICAGVLLISVAISSCTISITKSIILSRISTKLKIPVESATMMRILSLPASFFKQYNSGDLATRAQNMNVLCNLFTDIVLSTGLTSIFSIVYIFQIFSYSKSLALPAIIILLITVIFAIFCSLIQMKQSKKKLEAKAKENGLVFSLLSGIQKIKLSGCEKRVFAKWSSYYQQVLEHTYNPPKILIMNGAISTFISLIGTAVIYYIAVSKGVSTAEYMTFNVAYGMVLGAFVALAGMSLEIAEIKPTLEIVDPIFKTVPEVSSGKKVVTRLMGNIELNNVSFRYTDNSPNIIDNLSLKIKSGQYVAIVGATGCGKSTLMRLMLGFETPQKGAVFYDGKDLATIDLKSLRRNIGTVMQNSKLFSGDIYSNIVISATHLSLDDAWKAAEMAGIADDIRNMPMNMHTIISEGSGGISGGQRQRIMIARAIAPKPKILMFDEATSALDNITQKIVSQSLDNLKCTRIVIAHRLSTIKQCDRIIVLEKGKIIEDGTYDELINNNGFFSELVQRQKVDF